VQLAYGIVHAHATQYTVQYQTAEGDQGELYNRRPGGVIIGLGGSKTAVARVS
jgi:hypothetical protein